MELDKILEQLAELTCCEAARIRVMQIKPSDNLRIVQDETAKDVYKRQEMPSKVGVAAGAFALLNEAGIDILLITTSEVDISIVVTSANSDAAYAILKKEYMTE